MRGPATAAYAARMRIGIPSLIVCAGLVGCAPVRLLTRAELEPKPPRRLALAAPEPRRLVVVDGVSLAVHDSDVTSSKPVIVCLHAIGHGGGDFAAFEAAFVDRFRIITVDWPGQGASGQDTQPASAGRYASLLLGLLDELGLERPILFGNSIDGAAAITLAQQEPARVRALVLSNPGGLDPGGFFSVLLIDHLISRFQRGVAGEARFRDWFADYYADILLGPEAAVRRDAIIAAGYESAPRLVEAWTSFAQPDADLRPGLPSLQLPVFVRWAMRDRLVQWSCSRDAIVSIPRATIFRFESSGHMPFLEESAAFNAAVAPFLDDLP
jgi:4,5:9,10-diseco-3-hydroxy-5,9,17-trioxoandrosta-1(10),2-diene-4-oate hydrolase